jgi:hypothetical protein
MATWRDIYLIQFLKESPDARLTCGYRWLVWYGDLWTIYERQPYQKRNRVLYSKLTLSQKALDILEGIK